MLDRFERELFRAGSRRLPRTGGGRAGPAALYCRRRRARSRCGRGRPGARCPAREVAVSDTEVQARLARVAVGWLADLRERLADAVRTGRLPHAVLLLGPEQAGQAELACWLAGLLLCERGGCAACGDCVSCRLFLAGTHPDCHWVGIEADASAIRVEQIRDLAASLETRSFRGHRKVVVIDPADPMNISSFNALLKTLEEPSENTYLLLTASRRDRLPATIRSLRCCAAPHRTVAGACSSATLGALSTCPGALGTNYAAALKTRCRKAGSPGVCRESTVRHPGTRGHLASRPTGGSAGLAGAVADRPAAGGSPAQ